MEYINRLLHRTSASPARPSSPASSSGSDSSLPKPAEHEVKVRFAREFADVGSITYSAPESLSSASSFHSLSSSLSTKSSSGICPDSTSHSPDESANISYVNPNIPGVEDLIRACTNIQLNRDKDESFLELHNSQDLSQDQTFTSATEEPVLDITQNLHGDSFQSDSLDATRNIDSTSAILDRTQDIQGGFISDGNCTKELLSQTTGIADEKSVFETEGSINKTVLLENSEDITSGFKTCSFSNGIGESVLPSDIEKRELNVTVNVPPNISDVDSGVCQEKIVDKTQTIEASLSLNSITFPTINSNPSISIVAENIEFPSLPSISTISSLTEFSEAKEISIYNTLDTDKDSLPRSSSPIDNANVKVVSLHDTLDSKVDVDKSSSDLNINSSTHEVRDFCKNNIEALDITTSVISKSSPRQSGEVGNAQTLNVTYEEIVQNQAGTSQQKNENNIHSTSANSQEDFRLVNDPSREEDTVAEEFIPAKLVKQEDLQKSVEESATKSLEESLDNTLTLQDISINSESAEEVEQYAEFKPQRQSTTLTRISDQNFIPPKAIINELANENTEPSLGLPGEDDYFVSATSEIFQDPKSFDFLLARSNSRNIDRLRAESFPLPTGTIQKSEKPQEKIEEPIEETKPDMAPTADINMSKELELVRATVLQLEEQLEKQKKEYDSELDRQKTAYQDKINKLQVQLAQEVESKLEMKVVTDEYEKSISRLLTEREKYRKHFEEEMSKLQDELRAEKQHLSNTEAAFNDVHQKYERLKAVISAYKCNEAALKKSIQANAETIKTLESKYDHLKKHATTQLEKANLELDGMRKQHEAEIVKLHAIIRKLELQNTSLAELVEQKSKENKELTQILDEVIARVGHPNVE
ncbi:hypothetical protein KM043_017748 [Ampulex compressa]|nr:hypothetical protein KM043_017748 [Ampulex compressa]